MKPFVMLNEVKHLAAIQRGFKEMFRFAQHDNDRLHTTNVQRRVRNTFPSITQEK